MTSLRSDIGLHRLARNEIERQEAVRLADVLPEWLAAFPEGVRPSVRLLEANYSKRGELSALRVVVDGIGFTAAADGLWYTAYPLANPIENVTDFEPTFARRSHLSGSFGALLPVLIGVFIDLLTILMVKGTPPNLIVTLFALPLMVGLAFSFVEQVHAAIGMNTPSLDLITILARRWVQPTETTLESFERWRSSSRVDVGVASK